MDDGMFWMTDCDGSRLGKRGFELGPPSVVERTHRCHFFRMRGEHVALLSGICCDVIQFLAVHETPLAGHDGGLFPLDGITHALGIGDEHAVVRPVRDIACGSQQSADRATVDFDSIRFLRPANV